MECIDSGCALLDFIPIEPEGSSRRRHTAESLQVGIQYGWIIASYYKSRI